MLLSLKELRSSFPKLDRARICWPPLHATTSLSVSASYVCHLTCSHCALAHLPARESAHIADSLNFAAATPFLPHLSRSASAIRSLTVVYHSLTATAAQRTHHLRAMPRLFARLLQALRLWPSKLAIFSLALRRSGGNRASNDVLLYCRQPRHRHRELPISGQQCARHHGFAAIARLPQHCRRRLAVRAVEFPNHHAAGVSASSAGGALRVGDSSLRRPPTVRSSTRHCVGHPRTPDRDPLTLASQVTTGVLSPTRPLDLLAPLSP